MEALLGIEILCLAGLLIIGQVKILREVKKGNKDQQEIKTRLHYVRERLITISERKNGKPKK